MLASNKVIHKHAAASMKRLAEDSLNLPPKIGLQKLENLQATIKRSSPQWSVILPISLDLESSPCYRYFSLQTFKIAMRQTTLIGRLIRIDFFVCFNHHNRVQSPDYPIGRWTCGRGEHEESSRSW